MMYSGFRFGRKRRPASIGAIALFVALFVGWDYVLAELQRREEYSGTIVRVYAERSLAGGRSFTHYWDVRSADGQVHSARIRPKSVWSTGHSGNRVIKRAGEVNPSIAG